VTELKNNKGGDDKAETIQHGACLGIGLAGMATGNEELLEDLKSVLFSDSAVAGEAAGLAMGLVMLGTANGRACEEMLSYAQDTQHEKIIRGLSIGMALIMYGREEGADTLIEQLTRHKDPILRYGGMYTIATAYAGTGSNKAIRRLLHVAVSDVSNDVRRAPLRALASCSRHHPSSARAWCRCWQSRTTRTCGTARPWLSVLRALALGWRRR